MPKFLSPQIPTELAVLLDLALDLRWSWCHDSDALWRRLDPDAWMHARNPWTILENAPEARLCELATDKGFTNELEQAVKSRRAYLDAPAWFDSQSDSRLGGVALFSLEFGLTEALPLYAGGLGILAGDILKTASDLGVPIVGVGLLYQEGYFRQLIDAEGLQREAYPYNEPASLPIQQALGPDGGWIRIGIELPGRVLSLRVWRASIGRTSLYLLDSNDPSNSPFDRGITGKLYCAGVELRLLQELVLGVGGWRAVELLEPQVEVCHLNEGHAAFAVFERARSFAQRTGLSFHEALWATRGGNVFTTHTAVPAGFDLYPLDLIAKYLGPIADSLPEMGIVPPKLDLGHIDVDSADRSVNMAHFALRGSYLAFGVSKRHERVSREIFQGLFPRWPECEVPIDHVTNGVHMPSWDSQEADEIWTRSCGKERWRQMPGNLATEITTLADTALWSMRGAARQKLVNDVRRRLKRHLSWRGHPLEVIAQADHVLDPNILTLGFARRFTGYKRPNLLLRDVARLGRLLNDPSRPVQLVVAGKAHPDDKEGIAMIRQWIDFAGNPDHRRRVVFLEDYDISLAEELVRGVDVWINTPRRPWEACGTSGMKVLVNGGLNLSELDGWWEEAYDPALGWAIGDRSDRIDGNRDAEDAEELYATLERSVVPEYYARDATGVPGNWVARIRKSMANLTPAYACTRAVSEYLTKAYLPAAKALRHRVADGGIAAKGMVAWESRVRRAWSDLHIGAPDVKPAGEGWHFTVPVYFGAMIADDVRVELYADTLPGGQSERVELRRGEAIAGTANGYIFSGSISGNRAWRDFTARIVPNHSGVRVPTELPLILWQK